MIAIALWKIIFPLCLGLFALGCALAAVTEVLLQGIRRRRERTAEAARLFVPEGRPLEDRTSDVPWSLSNPRPRGRRK